MLAVMKPYLVLCALVSEKAFLVGTLETSPISYMYQLGQSFESGWHWGL